MTDKARVKVDNLLAEVADNALIDLEEEYGADVQRMMSDVANVVDDMASGDKRLEDNCINLAVTAVVIALQKEA